MSKAESTVGNDDCAKWITEAIADKAQVSSAESPACAESPTSAESPACAESPASADFAASTIIGTAEPPASESLAAAGFMAGSGGTVGGGGGSGCGGGGCAGNLAASNSNGTGSPRRKPYIGHCLLRLSMYLKVSTHLIGGEALGGFLSK